jgi:serine/threonine protein kinase
MRDGRYEDAQTHFAIVINKQYRKWLNKWNVADQKDYGKLAEGLAKDCKSAIKMQRHQITEETEIMAWVVTNQLAKKDAACSAQFLMVVCNLELPKEVSNKIDMNDLREAEEGDDTEDLIDELQKLHDTISKRKAKKMVKKAKELTQLDEVKEELDRLGVVTLGTMLDLEAKKQQQVRDIFEATCQRGLLFDDYYACAKTVLNHEGCNDTLTTRSIGTLSLMGQTLTTKSAHAYTKNLFGGQTRSVRGNPLVQAKFDKDITEMAPESEAEDKFHQEARKLVACKVQSRSKLYRDKNGKASKAAKKATCPTNMSADEQKQMDAEVAALITQVRVVGTTAGSVVLHLEFTDSKVCGAEQVAAFYCEALQQDASTQGHSITDDTLGFMPKATLQLLSETGALEAFSTPPKEREHDEMVTLWQDGDDKVACTIVRTLGNGAQGYVYETTPTQANGINQALKSGSFTSMKNEALIFLKANHPHSHPNVLRVDYVHAMHKTNEMLCLMERVEGPKEGVCDLEQAIETGALFEGTGEEVRKRLASLTAQLAFALEYLHRLGVVHQDVKLANLLIDKDWRLVLSDFGISSIGECDSEGNVANAELKGCTPTFCSEEDFDKFEEALATGVVHYCTHHADVFCFVSTVLEMYSGTVDGSWRGGRPLRVMWKLETQELPQTGYFDRMPVDLLSLLKQALESNSTTMGHIVVKLLAMQCEDMPPKPPLATGIEGSKAVLMYDRIGAALHHRAKFEESLTFYQSVEPLLEALDGPVDPASTARVKNNAGVVLQRLGRFDEAISNYNEALKLQKEYPIANNNLARLRDTKNVSSGVMDTSGTQAAFKVQGVEALETALRYRAGQRFILHGDLCECRVVSSESGVHHVSIGTQSANPVEVSELVGKCYQLWTPLDLLPSEPSSVEVEEEVRVRVDMSSADAVDPEWHHGIFMASALRNAIDEAKAQGGIGVEVRWDNKEGGEFESLTVHADRITPGSSVSYEAGQSLFVFHKSNWHHKIVKESPGPGSSTHTLHVEGKDVTMNLNSANHAPALFASLEYLAQAFQLYSIQLTDEHKYIYDIFSGEELSTLNQTATLQYREERCKDEMLATDEDLDRKWYEGDAKSLKFRQQRRKSLAAKSEVDQQGVHVMNIINEMLGNPGQREVGFLTKTLLLILGPAASGKTTLLKTFIMQILQRYPDFVPILIPVIDLVQVIPDEQQSGDSVVVTYIKSKFQQHTHVLLQAMLQRRAVFLVDGIDESGSKREAVQRLIADELLIPGHNTIITSRHGGFSADAFKQCRLLELLPLTATQQAQMVNSRMPKKQTQAKKLIQSLSSESGFGLEEIAGNPLMLTMLVSIYISNGYHVITNKTELYDKGIKTIVGRRDKLRAGVALEEQTEVVAHLQQLAFHSHIRPRERRIFTSEAVCERSYWSTCSEGWSKSILPALQEGRLPIISSMGLGEDDKKEWRFTHMTYQVSGN